MPKSAALSFGRLSRRNRAVTLWSTRATSAILSGSIRRPRSLWHQESPPHQWRGLAFWIDGEDTGMSNRPCSYCDYKNYFLKKYPNLRKVNEKGGVSIYDREV